MKYLLTFLTAFIVFIFSLTPAYATSQKFVTIVNPVRGGDFFQLNGAKPVTNLAKEWQIIQDNNLPATWLIRPDALKDSEVVSLLKSFPNSQELGLFLEITPSWTKMAAVFYHQSTNWHAAGTVFLTGYEVDERHKLIDTAFADFKNTFGYYPKSVGAWWIDAGSLAYMKERYGVMANMDVADQYTTDNYQVWGQYFSQPFYPTKRNALIPAESAGDKIGLVTIQWALRDPFNSYGNGVLDSTYSVQANDYANKKYHNLTTDYFKKLLEIYLDNPYQTLGQVTVGIENDFSWADYGAEYGRQIEVVKDLSQKGINAVTMSSFAQSYASAFPDVSPKQILSAADPLGSGGSVLWFDNLRYRVGWFYNKSGSVIRDLRTTYDGAPEPCLKKSCSSLNLAMTENKNLDEVTYGNYWLIDTGKISNIQVNPTGSGVNLSYFNQSGIKRQLQFLPNDIKIDNSSRTVATVISQEANPQTTLVKTSSNFNYQLVNLKSVLIQQAKNLTFFIIFSLFFFYYPGLIFLKKLELNDNEKFIFAWPVGLTLFVLISFILGYLKLPILIWFLPLSAVVLIRNKIILPKINLNKFNLLSGLVILLGSVSWLLTMVKSGLLYDYGLGFWGPNGHDALWHLAIINNLNKGLPPVNPIYSGTVLQNYHYFYDLLLAQVNFVTQIPAVDLYFRFFPLLVSIAVGLTAFILAKHWLGSRSTSLWTVFFLYFGGSFGWVLTFIKNRSFGGETTFWAQQSISTLINPPFAVSVLIFLAGLFFFYKILEQKSYRLKWLLPPVFLWGTLIEYKAYAGILMLIGLCILTGLEVLRKNWQFLKLSVPVGLLSLAVFLPNNLGGSSLLVWSPFWMIDSMIDFEDRLHFMRLSYSRIVNLQNHNWIKVVGVELAGLTIFLLGNLGTRAVAFLNLSKRKTNFNLFILTFLIFSLLFSILFIQKGANFNTIQFFYYFLLIFNFMAAVAMVRICRIRVIGVIFAVITILLTIPTTYGDLSQYLPARPPAMISTAELSALDFLKNQPPGVVLSYGYDPSLKERYLEPKPLFVYDSTAYVSAFAAKPEFAADTVNLDILGIDYKGRLQIQRDILTFTDPAAVEKLLKLNKIKYIYLLKISNLTVDSEKFNLKEIFQNNEVKIYQVI